MPGVTIAPNPDLPDLMGARFERDADFRRSRFSSFASFNSAHFTQRADFRDVTFKDSVSFRAAVSDSEITFWGATFGNYASFRYFKPQDTLNLMWCILPDSMDFKYLRLSSSVDLTKCLIPRSGNKCRIALYGTDLNKLKINMEVFELWFPPDTVRDSIEIPRPEDRNSLYQQLLKKFQDEGYPISYEIVDKEYRRYHDWDSPAASFWGKLTYWPSLLWWDFGYAKGRVFLIALVFWLLASTVNFTIYNRLQGQVYCIGSLNHLRSDMKNGLRANCLRILAAFLYTAHVFFGFRLHAENFKDGAVYRRPWSLTWILFTFVFGLVCLGYIANFVLSF